MGEIPGKEVWAIGLMSGTSMDGIDAAILRTDGVHILEHGPALSLSYTPEFRSRFRQHLGKQDAPDAIVEEFTRLNADAVKELLKKSSLDKRDVAVVGFHGQTLFHDPQNGITVQIGNGELLSKLTDIDVVCDFRSSDVASGGEGAPLAPLYHQALALDLDGPVAILNLGGVGNVTFINENDILAFDTGPASAMLDDWVRRKAGIPFDEGGKLAAAGSINQSALSMLLDNQYFVKTPPKSLDRDDFSAKPVEGLSLEDGAATLTAFTVATVALALDHMPQKPMRWLVTGGGRKNKTFMASIAKSVGAPVDPVEVMGWRGDELEAEAFAYLAVRSLNGLPLSVPNTTGVRMPMPGGVLFRPIH